MRHRWTVLAGLGILLTGIGAWAQETSPTPGFVVLSERADQPAPMIVRGSPPPARPAPAVAENGLRWEVLAGKRLWLVDRAEGEVRSCIDRDTSTVGVREIRCTAGELGRYGRTFGAAFKP